MLKLLVVLTQCFERSFDLALVQCLMCPHTGTPTPPHAERGTHCVRHKARTPVFWDPRMFTYFVSLPYLCSYGESPAKLRRRPGGGLWHRRPPGGNHFRLHYSSSLFVFLFFFGLAQGNSVHIGTLRCNHAHKDRTVTHVLLRRRSVPSRRCFSGTLRWQPRTQSPALSETLRCKPRAQGIAL